MLDNLKLFKDFLSCQRDWWYDFLEFLSSKVPLPAAGLANKCLHIFLQSYIILMKYMICCNNDLNFNPTLFFATLYISHWVAYPRPFCSARANKLETDTLSTHWVNRINQDITLTSHEFHGVSSHRQLCCLLNSLLSLTTKKSPKLRITGMLWGNPTATQRANDVAWWRHQMETFSALLAICAGNSPVTGEFPAQRPMTRSFDVFFYQRLNKRSSKQRLGW